MISEAFTGHKEAVGPPWFGRFTVPLALVLTLLAGLGPVLAWRRTTAANIRRALQFPVGVAGAVLVALLLAGGIARKPTALLMFCLAGFVLAVVVQEFWRGVRARRAMSDDSVPLALVTLVRRNRRRYGGYVVHAGVALLFVGIAGSTAFQDARDVRLAPGESTRVAGYDLTYQRPTGKIDVASNGSLEKIDLGAVVRVRHGSSKPITLHPERSFFPSDDPSIGAVSRYFAGESTSEVGLRAGLRRDVWTVVTPNTEPLLEIARRGDGVFARAAALPLAERQAALGEALRQMAARYGREPGAVTFRVLVSPLVTWIWLGALVVFGGGLIALWPVPAAVRRRVASSYAARVGRELGRA
jgi:cytochrome c-type biogenesis protein CcmF